ncbi:MAG TPA: riboflavin synthase [Chthoniobacterales bacterium]|nr:riboflavin synthase [Chthoniobacterales bacterium]
MFTGIVEAVGRIKRAELTPDAGTQLVIETELAKEMKLGDSLALNGCCLTVTGLDGSEIRFDLLAETLRRTNLGDLEEGRLINLERPMLANGRFDGHVVQGHIDTASRIESIDPVGSDHRIEVALPEPFSRYVVFKGSIAVDGISLTVAELHPDRFVVWIIPHTWQVTNLHQRTPGQRVNLEFDLIAKYVERMVAPAPGGEPLSPVPTRAL